jgi:hypothetical protein
MSASDRPSPPPHATPRVAKLFEFVRANDRAPMSCELRFHGESYRWEVQFFERGELLSGRGAFVTKALGGPMDGARAQGI